VLKVFVHVIYWTNYCCWIIIECPRFLRARKSAVPLKLVRISSTVTLLRPFSDFRTFRPNFTSTYNLLQPLDFDQSFTSTCTRPIRSPDLQKGRTTEAEICEPKYRSPNREVESLYRREVERSKYGSTENVELMRTR